MKFAAATASNSLSVGHVMQSIDGNQPQVEMMFDIGCAIGCIGTKALECAYCLVNPVCWATCAGPSGIACLTKCF